MTITLQAVNELIQSLESAGELSIKETKVMALAKAYLDVAAENVAPKQYALDCVNAVEFWNSWADKEDQIHNDMETPATDRIVAGIKADEEKAVLNDLLRHLDKIDIENLSSPWELSSEVVAFVNSRLLREEAK
ncbi:hypothetical protein PTQ55_16525 [Klebsiella pasteurii]|uniref:hypothetical protein n=1 Tax=Klebsiella pasteurii TaxID=2587529 RepID=UPI00287CEF82|nr:hypothetical protein [Klebsiella pasteurii]MDS7913033.1 hypothetical protein [Klebsiella pasteurii]